MESYSSLELELELEISLLSSMHVGMIVRLIRGRVGLLYRVSAMLVEFPILLYDSDLSNE